MLDIRKIGHTDGYIERSQGGAYEGRIKVDGIDLSPVQGVYAKEGRKNFLWITRKPIMEWSFDTMSYSERPREPRFEAYLFKVNEGDIAYRGEFTFLRFKYSIVGIWDKNADEKKNRISLFVERLPMNKQTIINGINERKTKDKDGKTQV